MIVNTAVREIVLTLLFLLVWLSLRLFVLPLVILVKGVESVLALVERTAVRRAGQGLERRDPAAFQRIARPPFVIAAATSALLLAAWLVL
jgi:hypothetical protein